LGEKWAKMKNWAKMKINVIGRKMGEYEKLGENENKRHWAKASSQKYVVCQYKKASKCPFTSLVAASLCDENL
jgi:hypothetical protein